MISDGGIHRHRRHGRCGHAVMAFVIAGCDDGDRGGEPPHGRAKRRLDGGEAKAILSHRVILPDRPFLRAVFFRPRILASGKFATANVAFAKSGAYTEPNCPCGTEAQLPCPEEPSNSPDHVSTYRRFSLPAQSRRRADGRTVLPTAGEIRPDPADVSRDGSAVAARGSAARRSERDDQRGDFHSISPCQHHAAQWPSFQNPAGLNARTVEINLTRHGRALVEAIPLAMRHEDVGLRGLSSEEIALLKKNLIIVYRNLDALERELADGAQLPAKRSRASPTAGSRREAAAARRQVKRRQARSL